MTRRRVFAAAAACSVVGFVYGYYYAHSVWRLVAFFVLVIVVGAFVAKIVGPLLNLDCEHKRVRCIHGDEIIAANFRRVRCLDCGRSLDRPLPVICTFTGQPHLGRLEGT